MNLQCWKIADILLNTYFFWRVSRKPFFLGWVFFVGFSLLAFVREWLYKMSKNEYHWDYISFDTVVLFIQSQCPVGGQNGRLILAKETLYAQKSFAIESVAMV